LYQLLKVTLHPSVLYVKYEDGFLIKKFAIIPPPIIFKKLLKRNNLNKPEPVAKLLFINRVKGV
jgi:hypothetical protein